MVKIKERDDVKQIILDVLQHQIYDTDHKISMSDTLADDLGLDSLDMVEVIMDIEEAFDYNIEIYDNEQEQLQTVEDLFNLILNKLQEVK